MVDRRQQFLAWLESEGISADPLTPQQVEQMQDVWERCTFPRSDAEARVEPRNVKPAEYVREWLRFDEKVLPDKSQPVRAFSKSWTGEEHEGYVTLTNLSAREVDAVIAAVERGTSYLMCKDGRIHAWSRYAPLPEPEQDPLYAEVGENLEQMKAAVHGDGLRLPGIFVRGVGIQDPEHDPGRSQERLKEFGFCCYRTPRQADGSYGELWMLHYLGCSKGAMSEAYSRIREASEKRVKRMSRSDRWQSETEQMCEWLANQISFGSMEATYQRWALCAPD